MNMPPPTRPIIRYHGAKWMLAPRIIALMPPHRKYVEPYGGGGSVLMRKPRVHAEVYNEKDRRIANLFQVYRDHGKELRRRLYLTPFSREEYEAAWNESDDPIENARQVVVRSFMGFGSAAATESRPNGRVMTGFRGKSDRSGTTPAADWYNYPRSMMAMIKRLRGVVIENREATWVIQNQDGRDTLFYVDPPYVQTTRDAGSDYLHELTDEDHVQLASVLRAVQGKVILSGYHSQLYDHLYADWRCVEMRAFADGARKRTEVLWMNFEPEPTLF